MSYKEKLEAFNATEKYKKELDFLEMLLDDGVKEVLDYGCGNGFAAEYLNNISCNIVFGYDKTAYHPEFQYTLPKDKRFSTMYFMHSFAHIKNVVEVINSIVCKEIIVITPNRSWLFYQNKKDYTPDETVVKHYALNELIKLFEGLNFEIVVAGQFGSFEHGHNERLFLKARRL